MNLVTVNFRRNIYNLTKILSFAPTFTCLMKSKILKASKSCDIFALKIFKMGGIMLQTMWNICERVCESWSQQFWLLGLQLCLRVESRWYHKAYITFLAVGLTHSQQGQNSQPGSKLNEICAFDYPILVIPRWGRQTIHYIILLTGIGAKMSHVACHTIRAHFSHSYAKESKFKKILFLIGDKILRFSKNYERTRFSLREL